MITKEQVEAEAKKLSLTLTPEQVAAYVTIGRLPEKAAGSPPGDDDHDDGEDQDLTEGMRKRLNKEKEKTKAAKEAAEAALKRVREFEEKNTEAQRKEQEKKGQYDTLIQEANTRKTEYEAKEKELKERAKSTTIVGSVQVALLTAGVPADRLPKAVKLFDLAKVGFEWTDEKSLTGEVDEEGLAELVTTFKKENPFMFEETEEDRDKGDKGGFKPHKPPANSKGADAEKAKAEFKARHPRIFG